jgi:hypothetical protein
MSPSIASNAARPSRINDQLALCTAAFALIRFLVEPSPSSLVSRPLGTSKACNLIVGGNPLDDIRNLDNLCGVMKGTPLVA